MASAKASVLSVRLEADERLLLEAAAESGRTTVSDFVRRKAIEAAEMALMERRIISIPEESWEAFEQFASAPAADNPRLRTLMTRKPVWED